MEAGWRICLFGGLRAEREDREVTRFRPRKAAALLAYLAFHRRQTHPRELLIELLWPDCDLDTGRHRLSAALSALRRQLCPPCEGEVLAADHFAVGFEPGAVRSDVEEFERAIETAAGSASRAEEERLLAGAVALYRGELLPGFYDDWVFPERQRLSELHFRALNRLAALHEEAGALERALDLALRAVATDRLREEAHRLLMRAFALCGRRDAALRHYLELCRSLRSELDRAPEPATQELARAIDASTFPSRAHRPVTPSSDSVLPAGSPAFASSRREATALGLEPVGGAVPLDSPFYVERAGDAEFCTAIRRGDSVVLVKGAHGVGKTSLLARGLHAARSAGARVVLTDLHRLPHTALSSAESFFFGLAEELSDRLELDQPPTAVWESRRAPGVNLEQYVLRAVMPRVLDDPSAVGPGRFLPDRRLVWGLDEIDCLFERDFGDEVFHLFRSWHNERAFDPDGPWMRLTLAIAYATEAHLFIRDLHKSPFNVGTRLELGDFTLAEVAELNLRYDAPLAGPAEIARFHRLLGGHPYLVRRGLHEMAQHGIDIDTLEARAGEDEWIFGDHLRRTRRLLEREPELRDAVRDLLRGPDDPAGRPSLDSFYRLRSAGVLRGDTAARPELRCAIYALYLRRHLL